MITNSILLIIIITTIISLIPITEVPSTVFAEVSKKELCKENGWKWKDGACGFKTDEEDKAEQFTEYVQKIEKFDEDKIVLEDDLYDE